MALGRLSVCLLPSAFNQPRRRHASIARCIVVYLTCFGWLALIGPGGPLTFG